MESLTCVLYCHVHTWLHRDLVLVVWALSRGDPEAGCWPGCSVIPNGSVPDLPLPTGTIEQSRRINPPPEP